MSSREVDSDKGGDRGDVSFIEGRGAIIQSTDFIGEIMNLRSLTA